MDVLVLDVAFSWLPTVLVAFATCILLWLYHTFWAKPRQLIQALERQGIYGPPYRFPQRSLSAITIGKNRGVPEPTFMVNIRTLDYLETLAQTWGPVSHFAIGQNIAVLVADPDMVQSLRINDYDSASLQWLRSRSILSTSSISSALMPSSNASRVKLMHFTNPCFGPDEMKHLYPTLQSCIGSTAKALQAAVQSQPGQPVNLDADLASMALETAVHVVFGEPLGSLTIGVEEEERVGGRHSQVARVLRAFRHYFNAPDVERGFKDLLTPLTSFRGPDNDTAIINNAFNIIRRRRMEKWTGAVHWRGDHDSFHTLHSTAHHRHINMLDMMMGMGEYRPSIYPASMSDRQLLDECVTSVLAHQESSCNSLAWNMVMLARHPEWQERAREEVKRAAAGKGDIGIDTLSQLSTVAMVVNETLRLHPPVSVITRQVKQTIRIGDKAIPGGCTMCVAVPVLQRLPKFWGEDAANFKPERFSHSSTPHGAFIPFGSSHETGLHHLLPEMEIKTALATLLLKFSWTLAPEQHQHDSTHSQQSDSTKRHVRTFNNPLRSADCNVDSRPVQPSDLVSISIILAQGRELRDNGLSGKTVTMRQQSAHSASANVHGKTASVAVMLLLLVTTPPIAFFLCFIIKGMDGSIVNFVQYVADGGLPAILNAWPSPFNRNAWAIIAAFGAFEALLQLILPGKELNGPISPAGNRPLYWCNGFQAYVITIITYVALWQSNIFNPSIIYDSMEEIISALNFGSFVLCLLLYIKGHIVPSSDDWGSSGSFIQDFYWGMELYPRIGKYFDIKTFTNCRFGMMSWALLILSFAIKQYELTGALSDSMGVSVSLMLVYITKFFYWEAGYWNSMDIQHDRAGFYLCWGCLVWLPCVYTSPALYLVRHQVQLGMTNSLLILLAGLLSIAVNYHADAQRSRFRRTNGQCTVWGCPPVKIEAEYTTEAGEKKTSLLLASGWWGVARHFHYIPEITASLCWSLPGLFDDGLQYFYVTYLTILLLDRAIRDDHRCSQKYGKHWAEYCRQVPYKILPYLY